MIKITLFATLKRCYGSQQLTTMLTSIQSGKFAPVINQIRLLISQGKKEEADRLKRKLPAFTLSATYEGRRIQACILAYNPLIILDFDKLPEAEMQRLRERIEQACYTVACFVSPSGRGYKVIAYAGVGIPVVKENHLTIYETLAAWYEELLGIKADSSGSDIGRLCFVSYDPELYLSPRFAGWLNDTGQLPGDIPLMTPRCAAGSTDVVRRDGSRTIPTRNAPVGTAPLFETMRHRTDRKYAYTEGNRNNYVHLFASHCKRKGIRREDTEQYCDAKFADLPDTERRQAIDSAYSRAELQGTNAGSREGMIERIRTYLTAHFHLRMNVVRGQIEYREKNKKHRTFAPVTDYWENSVFCQLHLDSIYCKLNDLRAVIHSDFSQEYNPFTAYFEGLPPWDETTDPIAVLAATITTTQPEYWALCLRKWLVAVVACATEAGRENHSVLLLSGEQGLGKTTWCRRLVPPALADYVYSGNLDPSSKDAALLLSDCFLIILDELSGQSRMELNRMKAMITKDAVRERRAYAHNAQTYARRASFAATVNDGQVLTDRTGSRRFLCFEAIDIDYRSPIDHAGIYAQALALYRSGFKYWFSDTDITAINVNNEAFQQCSPEEELFYTYFRKPKRFEAPIYLTSSDIIAKIAEKTRLQINNINVNSLGRMLKRDGFEQQRMKNFRVFCVIELTFDQIKTRQLGLQDTPETPNTPDNQDD